MQFHDLLRQFDPSLPLTGIPKGPVEGVCEDSRLVQPGYLFVARAGGKTDGATHATDAIARGAIAIVTEAKLPGIAVPQVVVKRAATAVALLSHAFFGNPTEKVKVL